MKRTSAFAILVIFLGLAIGPVSCGGGDDDDADGGDDDDSSDDDDDESDDDGDSSDDDDDMSDDDDDDSAADDDSDDDVWVDVTSEYAWQTQAPDTAYIWEDAKKHCDDLSLGGHDDWRLPSISELRSLV
ncbi:DUF1566 domain-containing protein, partial [bacterium]|nr:DUF1566 domain-containing protein [bacterium]